MAVHAPTPEERALHWTIELLVTSQALSGDARMKILTALSPRFQSAQLPDNVTARLILDALNLRTSSFARVDAEDAEFVFESLITLGDIARSRHGDKQDGLPLELPEPPLHLTAMSYCETAVGALRAERGGARRSEEAVADFDERCDTYDLNDVHRASPWVDKRTLQNLQTALKRDANSLLRGDIDPARALEKHHASSKLCAALAAYCKEVIDALGPAFLERVARDIGAGTYAPDAEYVPVHEGRGGDAGDAVGRTAPTGLLCTGGDAATDAEKGFVQTRADDQNAAPTNEDDVDETASEDESSLQTRTRTLKSSLKTGGKRKRLASKAAKGVVALAAAAARADAAGDAWTNLAKHAGGFDGADAPRSSDDEYAFDGTEEEEDLSPGAEAARRRRAKLGAALDDAARRNDGGGGGGGATVAWGASQGDGLPTQGGTPVAPAALASRAARTTPGSLGRTYKRWSAAEEAYFLGLCEKHGEGKWAQMLAEGQQAGKLRADLTPCTSRTSTGTSRPSARRAGPAGRDAGCERTRRCL